MSIDLTWQHDKPFNNVYIQNQFVRETYINPNIKLYDKKYK